MPDSVASAGSAASASERPRPLGRNFQRLYAASVVTNLGDGVAQIGYPWLASAVTRNPVLIAAIGVAQRLPWLLFTLPAGTITDRVDRRRLIVRMDLLRGVITAAVAVAVFTMSDGLPDVDHLDSVVGTRTGLYLVLLVSALMLGCAEVLRDNSAQTILPAIVDEDQLERANGRMWSAELVANTFVGPPLGSLLLAASFFLPFVVDSISFFAAAGLVAVLSGQFRAGAAPTAAAPAASSHVTPSPVTSSPVTSSSVTSSHVTSSPATGADPTSWRADLVAGVRWLWNHHLLRTLAITLGVLNLVGALQAATLVLFAQEVLDTSPLQFAALNAGAAIGGIIGATLAPRITRRLGSGPSLWLTLSTGAVVPVVIGLTTHWWLVMVMFGVEVLFGTVWNVITVSLRQRVIPDHLLGRVNSVYRFFGWGMMPIGTAIGGAVVWLSEKWWSRDTALRVPWFVAAIISVMLAVVAIPKLTTARLEAARADAARAGAAG